MKTFQNGNGGQAWRESSNVDIGVGNSEEKKM